jgi:transcriptional regulator with XRE-family HTH domain
MTALDPGKTIIIGPLNQFLKGSGTGQFSAPENLLIGSGGRLASSGDSIWRAWPNTTTSATGREIPTSTSGLLAAIRAAIPLNLSQIADILGVSRPTVYAWIGDEQKPQSQCIQRLSQIYELAKYWTTISPLPISPTAIALPDENGVSILDLLKAPDIDIDVMKARLKAAAARLSRTSKPDWLTEMRRRGFDLPTTSPDSPEFRLMTRPPMDES